MEIHKVELDLCVIYNLEQATGKSTVKERIISRPSLDEKIYLR